MSDLNHRPDALDRAVEAVKAIEPPAPPSDLADTTISLLRNRLAGTSSAEAARRHRRRRIMRYMGYGTAAGLAAALLIVSGVLWSPGRSAAADFRRAIENQEKAKSYRAVVHTTLPDGKKPADRKLYAQTDKVRVEIGDLTLIGDGKAQKLVILDAKAKTAKTMLVPCEDLGIPSVGDSVKKLLARNGAEELGETFLDGRKVRGYRAKGLDLSGGKADVTYWIDGTKDLPVRLEIVVTGGPAPMTQVFDYLGFDEELDPKLFDQTIPPGYKVEEVKP